MDTTAHAFLSVWETYYVILGSSAAALTGLQFVVIALVADTGLGSAESVGAFGTPTVVHFCLTLFVAAVLSAPWQGLIPVAWLLLAGGSAGVVYTFIVFRRARRQTSYRPVAEDWIWHVILPLLAYGALITAGVFLLRDPAVMLFLVAAGVLTLIFIGIHNAWDSVAYLAVHHRPKPPE